MTSQGVHSAQIRDTSTYSYPDPSVDGGYRADGEALVKIVNTLDQSVTVTLYGSTFDDAAMQQDAEDDASTTGVSVAAGSTSVLATNHLWSYIRIEASSATAPTSGSLKIVMQAE